tara:strand:- start:1326 stop:1472 length:147 start_codon:yes stop_codon:yes gene_type:complete
MRKLVFILAFAAVVISNYACEEENIEDQIEILSPDGDEYEDPDDRGNG